MKESYDLPQKGMLVVGDPKEKELHDTERQVCPEVKNICNQKGEENFSIPLKSGTPPAYNFLNGFSQTKHAVDFGSGGISDSSELQACSFIVPALGRPDVDVVILRSV
ncbi:hypothetical protein EOD39_17200 [Acipenser ruthenus]|uniref:Uncharacterized protein n=1 Tax=Acipenser ruthenus TaxID=7906 RepID=A0A444V401_ACIRT|nr:hypothetical protein EOD39_17200 [Acipenser ruthenus]